MIGWKCINTERSQDLFEFWKPQKTLNKSDLLPQSQSQRQQKRFFLLYLDFTSKTQAQGAPLGAKALFFGPRRRPPSSLVVWLSVWWRSKGGSSSDILRSRGSILRPPDTTIISYITYNLYTEHERSIALIYWLIRKDVLSRACLLASGFSNLLSFSKPASRLRRSFLRKECSMVVSGSP